MDRKTVSIMIPCYNEEENIAAIIEAVEKQMKQLPQYDYEIVCIDNCSTDRTREILREICAKNPKIKAIFNVKNFGQFNSPVYGMMQTSGDCVIPICADFQDPVELIPVFLKYWEEGYQIVCGVKTSSKENGLMYKMRTLYYKLIKKFSSVDQIEHFTGFGLYDKSFIDVLRKLDDPTPFIRGIVAELGGKRKEVPYEQPQRRAGKTHNNFYTLYDAAMLSVTSYTKVGMRIAVFAGLFMAFISFIIGLVYLVMKLIYWDRFYAGQAPTIIIVSFMCSVLLVFMGFLGEYISAINIRMMHRPLVIEEERLNFTPESENQPAIENRSEHKTE
ncbi:MAG: glycosyltransferase family 2 protein [Flexilinea sp.]|nr:glycosyltransferase family 2 protein [Flexilinea sp.]